jgi:SulP family sulfate permease
VIAAPAVNFVDVAGAEMLAQEARRRRRLGGGLYFWRLQDSVRKFLGQGSYLKDIGEGGFFPVKSNITAALYNTLDPDVCRTCKARIFKECHGDALPDGNRRLRLMLATDGTEYSRAPKEVALNVAQRMGVTLDVMTMVQPDAEPERAALRLSVVHESAQSLDVRCEDVVVQGTDPAKAVIDAVENSNCQLLVIGRTPPKGRVDRMVGTHAARIIDESPSNILVVPKDGQIWQKRILVGYDANPSAVAATELATMLAKYSGVPVTLVTVAKENHPARPVLQAALQEAVDMMRLEGVEAEARLVAGAPADALMQVAEETGADLIVLGKRHGGLYRLMPNSPTDRLIGANRWPVLIAKTGRSDPLSMAGTRG